MTRAEFAAFCRSRQKGPKPAPVKPLRDPGDESEFGFVGTFADRLQKSLDERRASSPHQTQGKV